MTAATAATAAALRVRPASGGAPADGGDDFGALLAGLGSAEPSAVPPEEAVGTAPTDQPLPEHTAGLPVGPEAAPLVLLPPVSAPAAPVVEAPTAEAALPRLTGQAAAGSAPASTTGTRPAPATATPAASPSPAVGAAAGPAAAGTDDCAAPVATPVVGPAPAGSAAAALPALVPVVPAAAAAVAPGTLTTGTSTDSPAPAAAVAPGTPAAGTPTDSPTPAAPDAVVLSVPADVAGDSPVPALDARSTVSPAGPVTGAQTAGPAVVEALLPTAADAAPLAAPAADAPQPEQAPAAPAPASVVPGAEAGVAGPSAADTRSGAPAAPAAPVPPQPPATQVVQLLAPVLTGPDGSYSLSLQLYPEELGAVQVEVLLRGGEIRLALHAPDEAAQAVLRAALPDLRADLQAGGLSATSLSVDDGRPGQSSADRFPERRDGQGDSPGRRPHPYGPADPAPRPPPSHSDAALDLRM